MKIQKLPKALGAAVNFTGSEEVAVPAAAVSAISWA